MGIVSSYCITAMVIAFAAPPKSDEFNEFCDTFYSDPSVITVERDGDVVDRIPCERIPLDFPDLAGRGEGHVALASNGDIWAAVGVTIQGKGPARLFHSTDEGRTWTSKILSPTEDGTRMVGFTVLKDDTMLMVLCRRCEDIEILASKDMGKTWNLATTLSGAPLKCIGEGTESLTQLSDGRVLFPVARFVHPGEDLVLDKRIVLHSIYASSDGGKTFPVAYSTFDDGLEAHVLELKSGRLLCAFRFQRSRLSDETVEAIEERGGSTTADKHFVFKHVFLGDSDDGGVTWKNFRPLRDEKGQALLRFGECYGRLVQVPDGRIVLVHDKRYPYHKGEGRGRVSRDGGQTWGREIYHVSMGHGYPSSVVLKDGTIVTVTGNGISTRFGRPKGPQTAHVIRWKLP